VVDLKALMIRSMSRRYKMWVSLPLGDRSLVGLARTLRDVHTSDSGTACSALMILV
jgi:hypothetical protein